MDYYLLIEKGNRKTDDSLKKYGFYTFRDSGELFIKETDSEAFKSLGLLPLNVYS